MISAVGSALLERSADDLVFFGREGDISAQCLLANASTLTGELPAARYLINLCTRRSRFAAALLAAASRGVCTLLPPDARPSTLGALAESYPDLCIVHDGASATDFGALRSVRVPPLDTGAHGSLLMRAIDDDQPVVIAFTSGSTGRPTANIKPWKTLRVGTQINHGPVFGGYRGLHVVATVASQHMYGLETTILGPMLLPVAASVEHPFFPAEVAAALDGAPSPRALVTTPYHLRAILNAGVRLPRVEHIVCATAALDAALARQAEDAFCGKVVEIYGCTETGCLAEKPGVASQPWQLFPGFAIESGSAVGARVTAAHLPGAVVLSDTIEMQGATRFHLVGRDSDLVKVAGRRHSLSALNGLLLAIEGVDDGVIFAVGEGSTQAGVQRLAGLVVSRRSASDVAAELATRLAAVFVPRPLLNVPALPRGHAGKLDHAAVLALFDQALAERNAHGRQAGPS